MAETNSYSGVITVSVKSGAVDLFSKVLVESFYEATQTIGGTEPRRVFAKKYIDSSGMATFFSLFEKAKCPNVLEVLSLTRLGKDEIIAFEPFAGTLAGYLGNDSSKVFLPQLPNQLTEFSPRFILILRGIIKGIGFLHSLDITHGVLSAEKVYLSQDGSAKLGLWGKEASLGLWGQEAEFNQHGKKHSYSKSDDWEQLANLIVLICGDICPNLTDKHNCPKEFQEISHLVRSLMGRSLCSEREILLHPALWTTKHKRQFFHNSRRILDSSMSNQTVYGWYDHFSPGIKLLPANMQHYHPHSLAEFHRFGRNITEHIYDGQQRMSDVRNFFGQDQDSVMRRLQFYYPPLFLDLKKNALKNQVLDDLVLNEADAVVPFAAVTFSFAAAESSHMVQANAGFSNPMRPQGKGNFAAAEPSHGVLVNVDFSNPPVEQEKVNFSAAEPSHGIQGNDGSQGKGTGSTVEQEKGKFAAAEPSHRVQGNDGSQGKGTGSTVEQEEDNFAAAEPSHEVRGNDGSQGKGTGSSGVKKKKKKKKPKKK